MYIHHLYLVLRYFHPPKGNPMPSEQAPSFPVPCRSWQPLLCFWSLWICLFWTLHIPYVTTCVWLLSLSRINIKTVMLGHAFDKESGICMFQSRVFALAVPFARNTFPHIYMWPTLALHFTSPLNHHLFSRLFARGMGDELKGRRRPQEDRLGL